MCHIHTRTHAYTPLSFFLSLFLFLSSLSLCLFPRLTVCLLVSLVVIMFELTGGLTYIVPLMMAVVVSKWVGDALQPDGIYDRHIHLNGYPFLDNKEEYTHGTLAADIMQPREHSSRLVFLLQQGQTLEELEEILSNHNFFGFPIVKTEAEMFLVGYMSRRALSQAIATFRQEQPDLSSGIACFFSDRSNLVDAEEGLDFFPGIHQTPFEFRPETPMATVVEVFRRMGIRYAMVTDCGRLVGIITKKDVLRHVAVMARRDPNAISFD
eukprot:m.220217 g.220217  ORF g.220217 m.220217 type:complete len:267 (+) comp26300_c0_seq21:376-1176(+)